jgi:ribosomal protein S18 acetylase RimI-like enzyme
MAVQIEVARAVTAELVRALNDLLPQLTGQPSALTLADVEAIVGAPGGYLLVASNAAGRIVGSLTLTTARTPTRRRAHIDDVVVDASARGRGIGEALTAEAIRLARELGAEQVDLTSAPQREAANRLYRRLGFGLRTTNVYRLDLTR